MSGAFDIFPDFVQHRCVDTFFKALQFMKKGERGSIVMDSACSTVLKFMMGHMGRRFRFFIEVTIETGRMTFAITFEDVIFFHGIFFFTAVRVVFFYYSGIVN